MQRVVGAAGLEALLASEKREVVVLYYADWCPYCVDFLRQVAREGLQERVVLVDVSDEDDPAWDDAHLDVVPTLVRYREGAEAGRVDGRMGRGLLVGDLRAFAP